MTAADETRPRDAAPQERTVLFADIASSTEILREVGEMEGRSLIVRCLAVMTEVVEATGGEVVKRIGDELFCFYPEPDAAAHGASQMQQRVVDGHKNKEFAFPMRIRIGFEHGEVSTHGGEVYGTTIHTAKVRIFIKSIVVYVMRKLQNKNRLTFTVELREKQTLLPLPA